MKVALLGCLVLLAAAAGAQLSAERRQLGGEGPVSPRLRLCTTRDMARAAVPLR